MSTKQPDLKLIAQLGDRNPIEHGGYFIYEDTAGVYAPEGELLVSPDDDGGKWEVSRFILEKCTFINGILSDNKFHPGKPAWFAKPESERKTRPQDSTYLSNICNSMDIEFYELVKLFCSNNIIERAHAWRLVGEYHGFDNLDAYPIYFTRAEIQLRYQDELKAKF